ncbi:Oidioi.mRNA.OKI2018_I69.XSR.g15905.t1.cds [Oikopleura dioica]|uniref:Oidioi.mRNA.OKI2018_I69.XSR.g15905.t1.cds n=1 Tax=Oikopleura dioica TaxID=34765 RepID=A0ABN7SEC8_OIKDI|nr:Oidioi.mRNA.OKI2018_I69.XSR.g15905.t1.cds [Oikopleura dioica]
MTSKNRNVPKREYFNDLDKESESSPISLEEIEAYCNSRRTVGEERNSLEINPFDSRGNSPFDQSEYTWSRPKQPQQSGKPQPAVRAGTPRYVNFVKATKTGVVKEPTYEATSSSAFTSSYQPSYCQKLKCMYIRVNGALTQRFNPTDQK